MKLYTKKTVVEIKSELFDELTVYGSQYRLQVYNKNNLCIQYMLYTVTNCVGNKRYQHEIRSTSNWCIFASEWRTHSSLLADSTYRFSQGVE